MKFRTGYHAVIRIILKEKQEVLGRNNRLFSSDTTRTQQKKKNRRGDTQSDGHADSKAIS
jgi:hypothetical protein